MKLFYGNGKNMNAGDSLLGSVTHLGSVPLITNLLQRSRNVAESTSGTTHQSHPARLAIYQLCCSDVKARTPANEFLDLLLQMWHCQRMSLESQQAASTPEHVLGFHIDSRFTSVSYSLTIPAAMPTKLLLQLLWLFLRQRVHL